MVVYDDVDLEDMTWDSELVMYTYQCPCGDVFQISVKELRSGEEIARCPSCTLVIRVIYDEDEFSDDEEEVGGTKGDMPRVRCVEIGEH